MRAAFLRSSLVVAARSAAVQRSTFVGRSFVQTQLQQRAYSAGGGLTHDAIKTRVFEVLTSFEKVQPEKLTTSSSFDADLGLDSLDAVEVVMAVEEEFGIEIPDEEADAIKTVQQAIDYVAQTPEAR